MAHAHNHQENTINLLVKKFHKHAALSYLNLNVHRVQLRGVFNGVVIYTGIYAAFSTQGKQDRTFWILMTLL